MKSSGRSRRVMRRESHARSARASTFARLVPVPLVGVDAADDDVVLQHRRRRDIGRRAARPCEPPVPTPVRHTTPPGTDAPDRVVDDLPDARAFDDDVRRESHVGDGPGVVGRSEGAHEVRLAARLDPVEDVDLQTPLLPTSAASKTDRPRAGHEHGPRVPERALADRDNLLPRLGDDGRRLEQHAEKPEGADRPSSRTRARSASART